MRRKGSKLNPRIMGKRRTPAGVSQRTGEPTEQLQQWRSLGLIGRENHEELGPEDIERARFIQSLLRRGVSVAAIARADKEDDFLARYMKQMVPGGVRSTHSLDETAEKLGLSIETLRRFWEATGLSEQGESLNEEDVQVLQAFKVALDAGFPEEALVQLARVYVDALARVADAELRLFHFYVYDRLRRQ